jgi:hypothetical protein
MIKSKAKLTNVKYLCQTQKKRACEKKRVSDDDPDGICRHMIMNPDNASARRNRP